MVSFREENKPLGGKIIRSVIFGALRVLLVAPVPFLLTPLILRTVGSRGYGTWAVLVTMNSLTSLADLGLLGTLSKHVAEYHAKRDFTQLNQLLNTGLVVFGCLASLIVVLLWIASSQVIKFLFRGSALGPGELLSLFHCSLILIWVNLVTYSPSSVTSGLQRLDLTNIMAASNVFFAALAGAVLMVMGWGVRGLLYGSIASAVATLLIYAWLVKKLIPEFTLNPLRADLEEAKKIFAFSWRIYLVQASAAIQNHLEKILLAVFVGVVPVGWYDIASDTASKVRGVPGLMLSPILPAAAELDARGEEGKLFELYSRAHKYLAFVAVPLIFFSAMISTRFIDLWLGVRFNVVALPFAVLLIVNLINLTTGPGFMISVGQGQLWQGVRSAVTGIAVGVPLSIFLIHRYGFAGAVIGTSCSSIVSSMLFFYFFHHHTGYPGIKLLREAYLKPILCSIVLLTAEFFIFLPYGPTWFGLVLEGAVFAFLYATILLYFNFFDHYDWGKIEGLFPIARLARRIAPLA